MRRIRIRLRTGILIAWIGVSGFLKLAAAQTVEYRPWSEMLVVVGKEVALSVPDGTYLQGKALNVSPDGLDMDVKKTSDAKSHPKRRTTIPRDWVSVIELRTKRRSRFPLAAKVVGSAGAMGGLLLGGVIGNRSGNGNSILIGMGLGTVAGAVGGVLLGRQLDKETESTLIRVIPESVPDTANAPDAHKTTEPARLPPPTDRVADNSPPVISPTTDPPSLSGKRLIRRDAKKRPTPINWPVIPNRSRANWAF